MASTIFSKKKTNKNSEFLKSCLRFEITKLLLILKFYKYLLLSFINIIYYYKMGKIELFEIHIERPNRTYFSGELIKGHLLVKVSERLKINSLGVLLKGSGRVWWEETRSNNSGYTNHIITCSQEEEYLHCNLVLMTKQQNENECYLEAGEQAYSFQMQLPQNLPTSFEHPHARVSYSLKGTIDIPWAFDKTVNLSFVVIGESDLNTNPALRQPATGSQVNTICCCCCKSDPIIAKLSLPKSGYVPGEQLIFNASIDNKSNYEMKSTSLKIIQYILCMTSSGSRMFRSLVAEVVSPKKIGKNSYDEWNNVSVTIPSVCPSSRGTSKILDVYYCAVLHVDPYGPFSSFDTSIPIVIGTVPLMK